MTQLFRVSHATAMRLMRRQATEHCAAQDRRNGGLADVQPRRGATRCAGRGTALQGRCGAAGLRPAVRMFGVAEGDEGVSRLRNTRRSDDCDRFNLDQPTWLGQCCDPDESGCGALLPEELLPNRGQLTAVSYVDEKRGELHDV